MNPGFPFFQYSLKLLILFQPKPLLHTEDLEPKIAFALARHSKFLNS
jgi:hypothetical protein